MAKTTKQKLNKDINNENLKTNPIITEDNTNSSVVFVDNNEINQKTDNANLFQIENEKITVLHPEDKYEQTSKKEKKKKVKKPAKKITWKKRLFNIVAICVLGVVTGSVLGSWYFNTTLKPQVTYPTDEEIALLQDNIDDILPLAQGKTPANLTASQNVQIALHNLQYASSYKAIGTGKVATIATQSVYSEFSFDGETYESISLSTGTFKKVAVKANMKLGSNMVQQTKGQNIKETTADWTGAQANYTTDEYIALAGGIPSTVHPYIVSSKTVLDESSVVINQIQDENGKTLYQFTFSLDPVNSVALYVRQMKMISELGSYPEFKDVQNTFTIDENWNLIEIDVIEHYTQVAMGVKASCEGTLNTKFELSFNS